MFAIPGTIALIAFIYVRPQEFIEPLQKAPLLYVFFALALFGLAVDLRLRVSRPGPVPQLPWVILFAAWGLLTVAIKAPGSLIDSAQELAIPAALFLVIAHGVQTFRAFHWVAGALVALIVFLGAVGLHQAQADLGCVKVEKSSAADRSVGEPDGRPCTAALECYRDPEPGADYVCEKIGLFGTTSVAHRIRYRGKLQDPNELSLALGIGLALAFGFAGVARSSGRTAWVAALFVVVLACVLLAKSRTGQLVFMTVLGAYYLRRFRWKGAALGVVLAVPLLVAGGLATGGRDDASASTQDRLDTLLEGVNMFTGAPFLGVGQGQFTEHHYYTAHNAYLLVAAETGFLGLFLWGMVVYLSFKIPVVALRRYAGNPDAAIARTWAMALLAAMAGLWVGALFLSFSYHHIAWIYLGLTGAFYSCVKTHDPAFEVRVRPLDVALVAGGGVAYVFLLFFVLRLLGV